MPSQDQAAYMLARYHRRRAEAVEALGGRCARCGSTVNLEFDHVDPSTKSIEIGHAWSRNDAVWLTELAKCQLLCHPCHLTKSKIDNRRPITHGKEWAWRKLRCRCTECQEWRRDANIRRRAQRAVRRSIQLS